MSEIGKHPHDWRHDRSKPRVIRKVVKRDAKGRPKIARDLKTDITMERVKAMHDRDCEYRGCPMPGGVIAGITQYAKVTDHRRLDGPRVKGRVLSRARDYHFDCVPPEARPLVRFLVPCNWRMEMCLNSFENRVEFRWFTCRIAWVAWVDKNHPSLRKTFYYNSDNAGATTYQLGTNAYWSLLTYKPRFQKP